MALLSDSQNLDLDLGLRGFGSKHPGEKFDWTRGCPISGSNRNNWMSENSYQGIYTCLKLSGLCHAECRNKQPFSLAIDTRLLLARVYSCRFTLCLLKKQQRTLRLKRKDPCASLKISLLICLERKYCKFLSEFTTIHRLIESMAIKYRETFSLSY